MNDGIIALDATINQSCIGQGVTCCDIGYYIHWLVVVKSNQEKAGCTDANNFFWRHRLNHDIIIMIYQYGAVSSKTKKLNNIAVATTTIAMRNWVVSRNGSSFVQFPLDFDENWTIAYWAIILCNSPITNFVRAT
jgi:hypothetical protein